HLVRLRNTDALGEEAKATGRVAAPAPADEGGHARVVPARDVLFLHELDETALGERGAQVGEVEARELDLLGARRLEEAGFRHALVEPVVERPVILELQGTKRMSDTLDAVGRTVRRVVRRIDAPLLAGAVV